MQNSQLLTTLTIWPRWGGYAEEAFDMHGCPEIFNTDHGSRFTSDEFTGLLLRKEIQISMGGKGRALDNIFIKRFWRSVKY